MESTVNPCPPEWLNYSENALLRGDAIGDTAYSHRWVLKCLMSIFQAIPKYLRDLKDEESNTHQNENDKSELCGEEENNEVIELDSVVEDAACQLWDMTVERDVSLHILEMEEIDVFVMVSLIIEQSKAPRLTEMMVGVLANICCQKEGCAKLFQEKEGKELLGNLVNLIGKTSDVPTLIEAFRLMRLVLWHRINRTAKSTLATCPLIKLLCQEYCRNSITFILENSFSDVLVTNVLDLLSSLLFVCLPETSLQVSSLFNQKELIEALLDIAKRKGKSFDAVCEEDLQICHKAITALYAFVDTSGAAYIQMRASADPVVELVLFGYIEYHGKYENPEELIGEICDRLCCALGLCQLIIPQIRSASLILTVGRLLGVIHGETQQYSVSRSNSTEEGNQDSLNNPHNYPQGRRRRSSEKRDLNFTNHRGLLSKKTQDISEGNHMQKMDSKSHVQCGWLSPPPLSQNNISSDTKGDCHSNLSAVSDEPCSSRTKTDADLTDRMINLKDNPNETSLPIPEVPSKCTPVSEVMPSDLVDGLSNLLDTLEEYCFQLISWWWCSRKLADGQSKSSNIGSFNINLFDTLDQCHAHEVVFILDAVRKRDQHLVPQLQECLLDSGSHLRLVAILAHMYQ